jgi:hypothetical protein
MTLACAASANFSFAVFRTEGGRGDKGKRKKRGEREEINRVLGERATS